jgi:hypothetical protein
VAHLSQARSHRFAEVEGADKQRGCGGEEFNAVRLEPVVIKGVVEIFEPGNTVGCPWVWNFGTLVDFSLL